MEVAPLVLHTDTTDQTAAAVIEPSAPWFNATHAPIGAHATFTLGFPGAKGGLGLGLGKPADQSLYIGVEETAGSGSYQFLPFAGPNHGEAERYEAGNDQKPEPPARGNTKARAFEQDEVRREFSVTRDSWQAGALTFTVHSPVGSVPDPATATPGSPTETLLRQMLLPALLVELTVDNTDGEVPRRAYFGYAGNDPYAAMRQLDHTSGGAIVGVGQGSVITTAIATTEPGVRSALGFDPLHIFDAPSEANWEFGLGIMGLLVMDVDPGQRRTFRFAVCFHHGGTATTGLETRYLYTRWYDRVEAVAATALAEFDTLLDLYRVGAAELGIERLPADRGFMLAHAIRSYYASTQALVSDDGPVWVVNEGEYRMINTLDLTIDHAAFEARQHPWTLRTVLDLFADRYAYTDRVREPGAGQTLPGGVSFPHDMGVATVFSPPGRSAYELTDLDWCFSYMTGEQVLNWVLSAGTYVKYTGDRQWCARRADLFEACLHSLKARDPRGIGVQTTDSDRCGIGAEITTYDSLDSSLGQARDSIYLASKTWAAYLWLAETLGELGRAQAAQLAAELADRTAATIVGQADADGLLPAHLDAQVPIRIIPVVEGLAFAYSTGSLDALRPDGRFAALLDVFRTHLRQVLVPGMCLFPDGGWKLSASSDNSWLSKIYLAQFTARHLLGLPDDEQSLAADAAHVSWLRHPTKAYWGWSDQIVAGVPQGSRYYPRGVSGILWLDELHQQ